MISPGLRLRLEAVLEGEIENAVALAGGCLFDVRAVTLADGRRVVVKTGASRVAAHLALEARMLADLAAAGAPVPAVLHAVGDLLVLAHVDHDASGLSASGRERLAATLAELHAQAGPSFGYAYDTVIGTLPQPNPPTARWLDFFRDQRLLAQVLAASAEAALEPDIAHGLDRLAARLDTWLVEPAHPSLLHGDLWQGNLLTRAGLPVAWIDPAISFGHPEIELAFGTLFGPFDQGFVDLYAEHRPLEPGFWPERRAIYLLYPLLVHRRLFGRSYARPIRDILRSLGCAG
ncbi:MAG: aminoglycoside phosphotransferase [Geminicoccaceae bacterium]|nr:MAG: aminoglycoside phosphotransferase [Geminicoccaceae bacterium]